MIGLRVLAKKVEQSAGPLHHVLIEHEEPCIGSTSARARSATLPLRWLRAR